MRSKNCQKRGKKSYNYIKNIWIAENSLKCHISSTTEPIIVTQFCPSCEEIVLPLDFMQRSTDKSHCPNFCFCTQGSGGGTTATLHLYLAYVLHRHLLFLKQIMAIFSLCYTRVLCVLHFSLLAALCL